MSILVFITSLKGFKFSEDFTEDYRFSEDSIDWFSYDGNFGVKWVQISYRFINFYT